MIEPPIIYYFEDKIDYIWICIEKRTLVKVILEEWNNYRNH